MTGMPRRLTLSFAVLLLMLSSSVSLLMAGAVTQEDGSDRSVNLQIIVDSSGSMGVLVDTGVMRMDAAKTVLNEVISQIPVAEGINVGLRVYGHRGDNTDIGRPESCLSSELVVPMSGVDAASLSSQVDALQPVGWTPIGYSLQ
jgi:Ca-activated chloride channel homolog